MEHKVVITVKYVLYILYLYASRINIVGMIMLVPINTLFAGKENLLQRTWLSGM
jgi:hypothetical protein